MRFPIQFTAAKNYFLGFVTSGAILISGLLYFNAKNEDKNLPNSLSSIDYIEAEKIVLQNFNPNELDEKSWKNLGFTEKQVETIFKYKNIVGGEFSSKEQLKKCYAISDEKFSELEPYILLPDHASNSYQKQNFKTYYYASNFKNSNKKELKISGKFNPDYFSATDFVKMGFSENQANSIIKYKNYLGGSFISKEKFKDCFIISEENYKKMEPYLLLPEKTPENFSLQNNFVHQKTEKTKIAHYKFDPNTTDLEGWKKLGFSEKQAQVIINYRNKNLKGAFKNLDDLANCFVISAEKFEEMKPFIILNPENFLQNSVSKNSENYVSTSKNNITKTDFSTIDLNQITYKQLIEFGFDEKSAGMLLGYRKKLGGFVEKQQIVETYNIDKKLAQELVLEAKLNTSKVAKYTLLDAPEDWLKNHPYFKYSADKIIFYRLSYQDEKKIWKLLKTKPEYETKMKLYLK